MSKRMKNTVKTTNGGRLRSRKGLSLVEVMVALAVIAIISAAALSLVVSSSRLDAKSVKTAKVMMAAENALECFRYFDYVKEADGTSNSGEFTALLNKTGTVYTSQNGKLVASANGYVIHITVDETYKELTFIAYETDEEGQKTEDIIYDYNFTKG